MRITIDMDRPSRMKAMAVIAVLKLIGGKVFVRRSANGKIHIKSHGHRIPFKLSLLLRYLLGDDRMRIKFDRQRLAKPKAILFTVKDGKRAGDWYVV